MKDPYSIFNEFLDNKEMPDVHFRRYAEIYMKEMISMLKERDFTIAEQKKSIERVSALASNLLRNAN